MLSHCDDGVPEARFGPSVSISATVTYQLRFKNAIGVFGDTEII